MSDCSPNDQTASRRAVMTSGLGLAAIATAPTLSPSKTQAATTFTPSRPSSGLVKTKDGVELFYKDWGPAGGQPIVFHHGWPLTADEWDDQIVPIGDSARLAIKLVKNGVLKTYPGFPHGMATTRADTINQDLLAFIRG